MSDSFEISSRAIAEGDPIPDVKNVILVMSGKGGVGKSTVAANLVMALQARGARVGLLDADIYGPSAPTMFGINERPQGDGNKILPIEQYGIKLMSIGFLLEDERSAVVWRGPMLHGALMQFLGDVAWGKLDFLVLDLPPGTGDVALTLAQNLQANGAVLVTTPQEVAVQDVYKAVSMNQKVGIPTLGVVENQSYFICEHGSRYEIFGKGGGAKVAQMAEAPLLGQIPIDLAIRECGDEGKPVVGAKPESASARAFLAVADALIERVRAENTSQDGDLTIDRSGGVNRHLPIAR
jgi:ATP-binding protein involved in chromosome partitioning